jgi:uncharacterized protein
MDLRAHYAEPSENVKQKCLPRLDEHCRNFIAHSPFLCLGTANQSGTDVSPRGDAPGFVRVLDDATLAIPDWPGNNRLDSLSNIQANPEVGMLFFVPGVIETLRVNGRAEITFAPETLALWEVNGKRPRSALLVHVREAFLHCGKALIRSRLWQADAQAPAGAVPTLGRMLKDQVNVPQSAEELETLVAEAYKTKLY